MVGKKDQGMRKEFQSLKLKRQPTKNLRKGCRSGYYYKAYDAVYDRCNSRDESSLEYQFGFGRRYHFQT